MVLIHLFLICSLSCGCGYHFRVAGKPIEVILSSIAIPVFSSSSSFMGYEGEFIRTVREEFITHSRVRIESKEHAKDVLSGRIYSITTEPLTYRITQQTINGFLSTDEVTSSRTMRVSVEAKLTDKTTGTIIWHDTNLTGETSSQ